MATYNAEHGAASGGAGMMGAVRKLVATLVELVHTRFELVATELEEAKIRLVQTAVAIFAALFLLSFGLLMLTLLVIVLFWDTHRVAAIASFAGLYLIGGGLAVGYALHSLREARGIFSTTLEELRKDRDQLTSP